MIFGVERPRKPSAWGSTMPTAKAGWPGCATRYPIFRGRPPLSDEPPGVLEAILLPGGIGVAGVHRNLVGSGNVEVDVGVDERQRVATPGEVTVLRSTAAGQGGAEPEPLLHRFVVHRPVEVAGDRLVGRHFGLFTAARAADEAR